VVAVTSFGISQNVQRQHRRLPHGSARRPRLRHVVRGSLPNRHPPRHRSRPTSPPAARQRQRGSVRLATGNLLVAGWPDDGSQPEPPPGRVETPDDGQRDASAL
jgi:hypothetical protein